MDGTIVINGVRAAYRTLPAPDGNGVTAEVRYSATGPWSHIGDPYKTFVNEATARRAIQKQVIADWCKRPTRPDER